MIEPNDFLQPKSIPIAATPADFTGVDRTLRAILAEMRKSVPKQRCIIRNNGGTIVGGLVTVRSDGPPAEVTFLNEGNPVKSFYTIIVNGTDGGIRVSVNEPLIMNLGGLGNGINVVTHLILQDVEIQYLSINTTDAANQVPVNGTPNATFGAIWVYGWTLREYANITE